MSLGPLAERIYKTLIRRLHLPNPLIAYGDLVRALGPLPPPYTDLRPNDQRLFDALEEISCTCRTRRPPLPALTSIAVRRGDDGSLSTPGNGYFAVVFPGVWDEAKRLRLWREEVKRVIACSYPDELKSEEGCSESVKPLESRRWWREPTVIAALIGLAGTLLAVLIPTLLSGRGGEAPPPKQADRVVVAIVPPRDDPARQPPRAEANPQKPTLDEILDVLSRHHQRATFGAVAGLLGRDPQSLFSGYTRTPRTAWVVNKSTGLPTGTKKIDYPDGLLQNLKVIDTTDELRGWLREHH